MILQKAGHEVGMYISEDDSQRVGDGLIQKVPASWDFDLCLFDFVNNGQIADTMRDMGWPIVGGGSFNDRLEQDREYAFTIMQEAEIPLPRIQSFDAPDRAIAFIEDNGGRWVLKPSSAKFIDKDMTYISSGPEDMISRLQTVAKIPSLTSTIDTWILEEFIDGIECSIAGWWNGETFIQPCSITIECKKQFPGGKNGIGVGPQTGSQINTIWYEPSKTLYQLTLGKCETIFRRERMVPGYVDVNLIIRDRVPYGLEFTPRFGYNCILSEIALLDEDPAEFFYTLALGRSTDFTYKKTGSYSLLLSIPPAPNTIKDKNEPCIQKAMNTMIGIPPEFRNRITDTIHLYDVLMRDGEYFCAGTDCEVILLSALHNDIKQGFAQCYDTLSHLSINDVQYRDDGPVRASLHIPILKNSRLIQGWT